MKSARQIVLLVLVMLAAGLIRPVAHAATLPWSQRAADAAIVRWPDGSFAPAGQHAAWNYELGTLLAGMDSVWFSTADVAYLHYVKSSVDQLVRPDGSIPGFKPDEFQLDNILLGRQLLLLYGVTQDARYAKAARQLYEQLLHQPRNSSRGFWHKKRYPNQMWLDGLYMAEPFYAEYAATFSHPEAFADITRQFVVMDEHAHDPRTGLLYHGWDASRKERWANPTTGLSSQFWARGMGWYMMALVDTLPSYPAGNPGRTILLYQLRQAAAAVARVQDPGSGLWYEVLDKPAGPGNYLESSASCMFVYALAKGVRKGYLPAHFLSTAERGYRGILRHFIQTGPGGDVILTDTVKGAGLGGNPYRDGSYHYYVNEPAGSDDPKGVGAFLLASTEMENAHDANAGRGKTVLLDAWFNSQKRPDAFGHKVYFHYKWNDLSNSGYSMLGHIFRNFGASTATLYSAPTQANLSQAQVYIIVSPDVPARNPHPNYMSQQDAGQIANWVQSGGVLMLMENDPANADIDHLNLLAQRFGIHYNKVLHNAVEGDHYEMGRVDIDGVGPIFKKSHVAYMKEICTITAVPPARPALVSRGDVVMAVARYGKGTVFAAVDPWLYNEYTDGRKPPPPYNNYAAGKELVRWILSQANVK